MIKGGAPLTAGRSFFVFRRKNSEKLRKTGKRAFAYTEKSSLIPCSSQIMRKFAAICNAEFAK